MLQVLFASEMTGKDPVASLEFLYRHFVHHEDEEIKVHSVQMDFARKLVAAVSLHQESIDRLIGRVSQNWKLHRIPRVDRNILRIAIAELVLSSDTPGTVVIDEAIDIGKRFGSENSGAFINGILDRIYSLEEQAITPHSLQELLAALDQSFPTS